MLLAFLAMSLVTLSISSESSCRSAWSILWSRCSAESISDLIFQYTRLLLVPWPSHFTLTLTLQLSFFFVLATKSVLCQSHTKLKQLKPTTKLGSHHYNSIEHLTLVIMYSSYQLIAITVPKIFSILPCMFMHSVHKVNILYTNYCSFMGSATMFQYTIQNKSVQQLLLLRVYFTKKLIIGKISIEGIPDPSVGTMYTWASQCHPCLNTSSCHQFRDTVTNLEALAVAKEPRLKEHIIVVWSPLHKCYYILQSRAKKRGWLDSKPLHTHNHN